ncbi:MAG: hypothetical protein ACE5F8_03315 [Woeseiaceae bacterium]
MTQRHDTEFLDEQLPLCGASHGDVVEYRVHVPMRYAECVAVLEDGRTAGFVDKRQFLGWSHDGRERALLFHNGRLQILLRPESARRASTLDRFVGIDGALTRRFARHCLELGLQKNLIPI